MGVYIKGMSMPECCDKCFAFDDNVDYPFCLITQTQRGYNFNARERIMDKCPLIEVPPHGRLIDASEKITVPMYEENYEEWVERKMTIDELLYKDWDVKATTVIPAEDGE